MELLLIFLAKIIEVSLTTVRTVFITKGKKMLVAVIGFVEVLIWLNVVSIVLVGISENPYKMFAYAFGFAVGNYVGLWIESKLAIGLVTIQVVVDEAVGDELSEGLRNMNIAVTLLEGEGMRNNKNILILHVKRKSKDRVIQYIENKVENSLITVSDVQLIHGGYGLIRK